MLKGEVDIGLRPDITLPITKVNVVDCRLFQYILLVVMEELDICTRPATLPPEEEIVGVTVKDMEVGLKRSTTLPCSILYNMLMVLGELDLIIVTYLLPPIIQAIMSYHLVFIVRLITEVIIGLAPYNYLYITTVD